MEWPLKIQGRFVTESDVMEAGLLLRNHPLWNRSRLSRELCVRWDWHRPDGQIKDIACRELLRKLELRGLIKLPPRQRPGPGRLPTIKAVEIDKTPITGQFLSIKPVKIVNARDCEKYEKAFDFLLNKYHYLSYGRPVGQNMKYLVLGQDECFLGCLLFGAAAWKTEARDQWIGWTANERERNLGFLCNNTRFLIPDWIKIPHLASHALGARSLRLPAYAACQMTGNNAMAQRSY